MKHPIYQTTYACKGAGCPEATSLQARADAVPMNVTQGPQPPVDCCCACSGETVQYYGQASQNVRAGAQLIFTRYDPLGSGSSQTAVELPAGRYLVSYGVNASALNANCERSDPTCTVTVGIAPWINQVNFPRGGSFATFRAEGSEALGSSFIVDLTQQSNTIGFYNTSPFDVNYQLLNFTVSRVS